MTTTRSDRLLTIVEQARRGGAHGAPPSHERADGQPLPRRRRRPAHPSRPPARGSSSRTPLLHVRDGDDVVVAASNGGIDSEPQWWLNLQADPARRDGDRGRRTAVVAAPVEDGDRDRLWQALMDKCPTYDDTRPRCGGGSPSSASAPSARDSVLVRLGNRAPAGTSLPGRTRARRPTRAMSPSPPTAASGPTSTRSSRTARVTVAPARTRTRAAAPSRRRSPPPRRPRPGRGRSPAPCRPPACRRRRGSLDLRRRGGGRRCAGRRGCAPATPGRRGRWAAARRGSRGAPASTPAPCRRRASSPPAVGAGQPVAGLRREQLVAEVLQALLPRLVGQRLEPVERGARAEHEHLVGGRGGRRLVGLVGVVGHLPVVAHPHDAVAGGVVLGDLGGHHRHLGARAEMRLGHLAVVQLVDGVGADHDEGVGGRTRGRGPPDATASPPSR